MPRSNSWRFYRLSTRLETRLQEARDSVPERSWWERTKTSINFGRIPIFMRMSQTWQSMSKGRFRRQRLDSIISMENMRTSEGFIQSSSEVERVPTMKVLEIHMQRDHSVKSASIKV